MSTERVVPAGPPAMKWWGWGEPEKQAELPAAAAQLLASLGVPERSTPPVPEGEVRMHEPALAQDARRALEVAVGEEAVSSERGARLVHTAGKGYLDLVRLRAGDASLAPDAVVSPADHDQVGAVLEACAKHGVAVVPFGGGTSVVGGVEPVRAPFESVVALDVGRLGALRAVDPVSLTATLEAGVRGPEVEALLGARGLTLGHFPQSFEFSTVGGWVAARSAGQASSGYGKIEDMVAGLRLACPAGEAAARTLPASAAGPALRELLVGSEGALGVITEATLRVRPVPAARHYEGYLFHSFQEGVEAFRRLAQRDLAPDVARLSDEHETRLQALAGSPSGPARRVATGAGRAVLRARGYREGAGVIAGFEGEEASVRARRRAVDRELRRAGATSLGEGVGAAWERGRYEGPYQRDALLDQGVLAETLETAAEWSRLGDLYGAVRDAITATLARRGTPPYVMCHVSHLYRDGASLYFTILSAQEEGVEREQWRALKQAAGDAISSHGGTITHHHGVGRDHLPWIEGEVGAAGIDVLRAAKQALDPAGVMNPGKLIPSV